MSATQSAIATQFAKLRIESFTIQGVERLGYRVPRAGMPMALFDDGPFGWSIAHVPSEKWILRGEELSAVRAFEIAAAVAVAVGSQVHEPTVPHLVLRLYVFAELHNLSLTYEYIDDESRWVLRQRERLNPNR